MVIVVRTSNLKIMFVPVVLIMKRFHTHGHTSQISKNKKKPFSVLLQNRLISTGLEPVLSHTEKSCIASYYRQFPRVYKDKVQFSSSKR